MSNLTDFLDSMLCVLNEPGKTMIGTLSRFKIEDGIDNVDNKNVTKIERDKNKDNMTPEEKKIAQREYLRNYMREYKKTYVQPEYKKQHKNGRRKYGTALITSARIRKNAEKNGYIITKNCYKVKKEQIDETENQVRKPESPTDIQE